MARPIKWTPELMEEAKVLYLSLLRAGKTEDEIDSADGVPCWDYRAQWLSDSNYSDDVQRARAIGAERMLLDGEKILNDTYQRALDEAASPQLVSITDQIMKHRRWKASKFAPKVYGDKIQTEHSGSIEMPSNRRGVVERLLARNKEESK